MDAFAELGLPRRAALDPERVRARFIERGKVLHPDGGTAPDAAAFERANQAAALLGDPATRLRHFIELTHGSPASHSGAIAPALMDIFSEVGDAVQTAGAVIEKKRSAQSALARALLASEVVGAQRKLTAAGARIREASAGCESRLAGIDEATPQETAESLYRELAFLGKWQREIQARFSGLF